MGLATPLEIRHIVIMSGVEIGGVQFASPENLSNELESISSELLTYPLRYLTFHSFPLSPPFLSRWDFAMFFQYR